MVFPNAPADTLALAQRLRSQLLSRQRPSGGWAALAGHEQLSVEATCLCLLALRAEDAEHPALVRGRAALLGARLPSGTWPVHSEDPAPSWTTALVRFLARATGLALPAPQETRRWLLHAAGVEQHWLWRLGFRLLECQTTRLDPAHYGWPWIEGALSWVIPTSWTLLSLAGETSEGLLQQRKERAIAMLFDGAVRTGGWNYGNREVLGVALPPHREPTSLALLALQETEDRDGLLAKSLDFLAHGKQGREGVSSLSWSILALEAYGRSAGALRDQLRSALVSTSAYQSDHASLAIASLALDESRPSAFSVQAGERKQ